MSDVLEKTAAPPPSSPILGSSARADEAALRRILDEIDTLGLNGHLLELETQGYTVLRGVLSADRIERAKAAILRRVERRAGRKIDPEAATADDSRALDIQHYLLFDDPVFPEILLEPKPLALITYLLGESCLLSSMGCHFRGPGGRPLGVHADGYASGLLSSIPVAMVANCNYALTPYSREAGALIMFPGSHRKQRPPILHENWTASGQTIPEVWAKKLAPREFDRVEWTFPAGGVTMDLNPGDAVVWHGNTWHGGWRRELPGVRMNLAAYFCRSFVSTQEHRGDARYPEVFERHSNQPRFARLLGKHLYRGYNGWREEGPDTSGHYIPTGVFD